MAISKKSCIGFSALYAVLASLYAPQLLLFQSQWLTGFLLCVFLLTVRLSWTAIIYPKLFSPLRKVPQPKEGSFFHGQGYRITKEDTARPMLDWIENIPNNGLIYYTTWFNTPRLLVANAEAMREVLSLRSYELPKPWQIREGPVAQILGIGVLFAEGDEHRMQRKNLMGAFSFRHVKNLYPVFWDKTRELIRAIDQSIGPSSAESESERAGEGVKRTSPQDDSTVEVLQWASRSTLDIIGVAGMGKSFNAISEHEKSPLFRTYQALTTPSQTARILGLLSLVVPFSVLRRLPLQRNQTVLDASHFIRELCRDMIQEKKQTIAEGKQQGIDILSVALESGGFTDDNLVDQMMTFLAAGHETTATALTWAIYYLCQYPEEQERLREALKQSSLPNVRDDSSGTVTPDVIDNIPYLSAVTSEVLRFMPPVPTTIRTNPRPMHIAGHYVPANTTIFIAAYAFNRSKQFWGEDASEFKPGRWLDVKDGKTTFNNSGGSTSNYGFSTFLHGPRSCIGQAFSRAEFACLLAGWVMAFRFKLADPEKKVLIQNGITQRPKGGIRVTLERLD